MVLLGIFRRDRVLKRQREEIYSQIQQLNAYKLKVENELNFLVESEKHLRLRLDSINSKLKGIDDETISYKNENR